MAKQCLATDDDVDDAPYYVVPIPLRIPVKHRRSVNVYAVLGDDGVMLVKFPLGPLERRVAFGPPDLWHDYGDQNSPGGVRLVARAASGHIVFEDRQAGIAFAGDRILAQITPSIALPRLPEARPLRSYLASLELFLDMPDASRLPTHGAVTPSLKAGGKELLDHHRDRVDLIRALVAAGSSAAYEVPQRMSWTRHDHTINELGSVHGMAAILEVVAHLELLVARGVLTRDEFGPVNDDAVG